MKDKQKLYKLLKIVSEITHIEGNEWVGAELIKIVGESSSVDNISKHSVIQNIHEYCVEKIITKQAVSFYVDFPILEIREQLKFDYMKMEHERRRDDFERFSVCIYQQIESITNYLIENHIRIIWDMDFNKPAIKTVYDSEQKTYKHPDRNGITIKDLVFGNSNCIPEVNKWYANHKFRAVLFYFYCGKEIIKNSYEFNNFARIWEEIYKIRNTNHRGGKVNRYDADIIARILPNRAKYYFRFLGFLQEFVSKIEENYKNIAYPSNNSLESILDDNVFLSK